MTALDFPTSPSDGDLYGNYVYNATRGVWDIYTPLVAARFVASTTKPSPAQNGDAWFDVTDGVTYIYYDDGTSAQWVETGSPVVSFDAVSTLTDTEITGVLDGQVLTYDSSSSKWINETPTSTLEGLSDTVVYDAVNGEVLTYDNGDWVNQAVTPPAVLQVVSVTKTDTFSVSHNVGFVDVTGMSATITPSSTSSKVMIIVNMTGRELAGVSTAFSKLIRGATDICIGDASGTDIRATAGGYQAGLNQHTLGFSFLDSPSSTSATTYKVAAYNFNSASAAITINVGGHSEFNSLKIARIPSTITLIEVAG